MLVLSNMRNGMFLGHFQVFNPKLSNVTVFAYEAAAISVPVMCLQCSGRILRGGVSGGAKDQGRRRSGHPEPGISVLGVRCA